MVKSKDIRSLKISLQSDEPNNFYRPGSTLGWEKHKIVDLSLVFPHEKAAIALKEAYALVKPAGVLSISYYNTTKVTPDEIEKMLWWLFRGTYDILDHKKYRNKYVLTLCKNSPMLATKGSISDWSFGIVTNGDRDDWVEQIIQSIKNQKIPNFEIIICGQTKSTLEDNVHLIPFDMRSKRGWITKKKNLIASKAKFENICIVHDRVIFEKNWYKGMKKYGNAFELLGCAQVLKGTGERAGDWITINGPLQPVWNGLYLHYKDWDKYVYLSGQLTIIKKSIWKKILWDETKYWNDSEDIDLCHRAMKLGYLTRLNPFSYASMLTWRHGRIPQKYRREEGLLPKDEYYTRTIRIIGRIIYATPVVNKYIPRLGRRIMKTNLFRHIKKKLLPNAAHIT